MKKGYRFAFTLIVLASLATISSIAYAGVPLGPDRFLIQNDGGVSEVESSSAYNPDRQEYLVVWQAAEIWGRRVSSGGALLGPAFRISPTGEGTSPDVAYSTAAEEYLVVWDNGVEDVRAQRVSDLGTLQGGVINVAIGYVPPPGFDGYYYDQPAVAYASTSDRYLVVFRYRRDSDNSSGIIGQVLTSSGGLDGSGHLVSQQSSTLLPEQPDVAYNRSRNEFLIVWQEMVGSDIDIYGRRFKLTGGAGSLDPEFYIGNMLSIDEIAPAVAAIPTMPTEGQYLVAWESDEGTDSNITARTVSWDGTLGAWRYLADTPWGEYRPAVAGSESNDQFLVTWTWIPVITPPAMMQVQAKTLALDGTPLHDTTLVGGGQVLDSAVAAGPTGDYLVTFDDNDVFGSPSSDRGIYARLWGNRVYLPLVVR